MLTVYQKERLHQIKVAMLAEGSRHGIKLDSVLVKNMVETLEAFDMLLKLQKEKENQLKDEIKLLKKEKEKQIKERTKELNEELTITKNSNRYYRETYGTDPSTRKKYMELKEERKRKREEKK